jgi:hypothetical protein
MSCSTFGLYECHWIGVKEWTQIEWTSITQSHQKGIS